MTTSNEFAITFSDRHRHGGHPVHKKVHPDGWVTVEAPDIWGAIDMASSAFGPYFASVEAMDSFDPALFPLGETLRLQ